MLLKLPLILTLELRTLQWQLHMRYGHLWIETKRMLKLQRGKTGAGGSLIPPTLITLELIPVVLPSSPTSASSTCHSFRKNSQKGLALTSALDSFGEVADLHIWF